MKFTFKTNRSTGAWRSFYPDTHDIKLNKVIVGSIGDIKPHRISLMVIKKDIMEDGNKNCKWKWIHFKKDFFSIQEAKDFLNDNIGLILSKFDLRKED